jgi:Holliday junction resolvase
MSEKASGNRRQFLNIEIVLYKSLQAMQPNNLPVGKSTSGKKFEDHMVMQLYHKLQEQAEFRVFPPRHTLREATYSGIHHQFDIIVAEQEELVAVECKFRTSAHIDQLFATLGKLIDYKKRPRGVFLTAAQAVNDGIYCYALAHQITLISPSLPPIEYMLQCTKKGTDLGKRLETLLDRVRGDALPRQLLVEWKNSYMRFQDEGYC